MNERERRVVLHTRALGVFNDLYARGVTPEALKEELVALFAPHSDNHQALSDYVIEYMVADAISFRSIADNEWAMGLFGEALRVYHDALRKDRAGSLACLSSYVESISQSLSTYWSHYHLTRDVRGLELEEFIHESLRTVGTVIEGLIKEHLYALVHQARIARGRYPAVDEIRALTLGNLIEELAQRATDPAQFSLRGVRLSQWRNIAQHFTTRVEGQTIVCQYNDGRAEVRLSRSEMKQVVADTMSAYKAVKVARAIVFFDCLDEMRKQGILAGLSLRPEASLVVLVSGLASQGFEVIETRCTPEQSLLVVQDLSLLDPNERRLYSTQFVIPLFFERPAETVVVEYRERDGTPSFRTTATRAIIERAEQQGNWLLVAEESQLTDLKSGRSMSSA